MLVASLCKRVILKLNILGVANLNYKSVGGTTKRGDQILTFQWGKAKGGGHDF